MEGTNLVMSFWSSPGQNTKHKQNLLDRNLMFFRSLKCYALYQENELYLGLERRGVFPTVKSDLE